MGGESEWCVSIVPYYSRGALTSFLVWVARFGVSINVVGYGGTKADANEHAAEQALELPFVQQLVREARARRAEKAEARARAHTQAHSQAHPQL
jgi:hypothetical protein